MRTPIPVLLVLLTTFASPSIQAGDTDEAATKNGPGNNSSPDGPKPAVDEIVSAKPIIMDSKKFNLTPDAFQKMAIKALLKYNWKIEANETTRVQGSYIKKDHYSDMTTKTYKVELRYTGDTIVIGFLPGFHHPQNGWLRNLEKHVKIEAAALRREAEVQRYLNK